MHFRKQEVSLGLFLVTFVLGSYVFLKVQVLQSYPFYHLGAWGTDQLFLLTYSQTLEVAIPVSILAFAIWQSTALSVSRPNTPIALALGRTLLFFGAVGTAVTYTEIHLLWGELWYGLHAFPGLPGGGGYPWGDEQVAYNLCFIKEPSYTPVTPNCYLLNYNEILAIAVAALIVGIALLMHHRPNSSDH